MVEDSYNGTGITSVAITAYFAAVATNNPTILNIGYSNSGVYASACTNAP